jgi:hypothetical protein
MNVVVVVGAVEFWGLVNCHNLGDREISETVLRRRTSLPKDIQTLPHRENGRFRMWFPVNYYAVHVWISVKAPWR